MPSQHQSGSHPLRILCAALALAAFLSIAVDLSAQCEFDWRPGDGLPGLDGVVNALTTWDPDGPGPETSVLVAGGAFTIAGETFANSIASWDGEQWHALDEGITGGVLPFYWPRVLALAVYNGELVAGGSFTTAGNIGVNNIARWNGANWQPLGSGISGAYGTHIRALIVYNGELVAAGWFSTAGGVNTNNIARWNGIDWQPLGLGVDVDNYYFPLQALVQYGNELIVGGDFDSSGGIAASNIARWNGLSWQSLGPGLVHQVTALIVFEDDLVAAAGGFSTDSIVSWNGTEWQSMGTGLAYAGVAAFFVYGGDLFAGGWGFQSSSGTGDLVVRWNGSAWNILGTGLQGAGDDPVVGAFAELNGDLIVGGGIFSGPEGIVAQSITRWDGAQWHALGSGMSLFEGDNTTPSISAFTQYFGDLIIAGNLNTSGPNPAEDIARWDGYTWQPLGAGIASSSYSRVCDVTVYNGELIVAGEFSANAGAPGNNIARWNGSFWQSLGSGTNGSVSSLTSHGGDLIAVGSFTLAGSIGASRVARWDGATWHALGAGLNFQVETVVVFNGDLLIGGQNGVVRWNGAQWQSMGEIGWVHALAEFEGNLIAAGGFVYQGMPFVKRRVGSSWETLALGTQGFGGVGSLAVYNGHLFAAGDYSELNGQHADNIAGWDGTTWYALGGGTGGRIYELSVVGSELLAGGIFTSAGGHVSAYLARWAATCPPADLNCNQAVTPDDIAPFVNALLDPSSIDNCLTIVADVNHDGALNALDVQKFTACLLAGGCN